MTALAKLGAMTLKDMEVLDAEQLRKLRGLLKHWFELADSPNRRRTADPQRTKL